MIEAALKWHEETMLQCLIDYTVQKNVFYLYKKVYDKALAGICTELYQMVEQFVVKSIYLENADGLINTKLAELQNFMQNLCNVIMV